MSASDVNATQNVAMATATTDIPTQMPNDATEAVANTAAEVSRKPSSTEATPKDDAASVVPAGSAASVVASVPAVPIASVVPAVGAAPVASVIHIASVIPVTSVIPAASVVPAVPADAITVATTAAAACAPHLSDAPTWLRTAAAHLSGMSADNRWCTIVVLFTQFERSLGYLDGKVSFGLTDTCA